MMLTIPNASDGIQQTASLMQDDVLIEDGRVAPFRRTETSYAAMGRFGNVLLVAGEPELALEARQGEVVRLYLTNTANRAGSEVVSAATFRDFDPSAQ